jgi:hypothetical protein
MFPWLDIIGYHERWPSTVVSRLINWIGLSVEVIVILSDVKAYSTMHIFYLAGALAIIVIVILIDACPCNGMISEDVVYLKPDIQNSGSVYFVKTLPDFINFQRFIYLIQQC